MTESDYISRPPRHEAQPDAKFHILVTVIGESESFPAQIADLSRQGLKAVSEHEFPKDAKVLLQIDLPIGRLTLAPSATVRWCRWQDDGYWAVGFLFDGELSWEVMGELFLNGVLAHDEPSSAPFEE